MSSRGGLGFGRGRGARRLFTGNTGAQGNGGVGGRPVSEGNVVGAEAGRAGTSSHGPNNATQSSILPSDFGFDDPNYGGFVDVLADEDAADEMAFKKGEVYAAVLCEGDRLGIAYYDCEDGSLNATSTHCSATDVPWVIATFKQQLAEKEPTAFITSSHVSEAVKQELAKRATTGEAMDSQQPSGAAAGSGQGAASSAGRGVAVPGNANSNGNGGIPVKILPSSMFKLDMARKMLASIQLPEWQSKARQEAFAEARSSTAAALVAAAAAAARKRAAANAAGGAGGPSGMGVRLGTAQGRTQHPQHLSSNTALAVAAKSVAKKVPKHPKDKSTAAADATAGAGAASIGLGGLLGEGSGAPHNSNNNRRPSTAAAGSGSGMDASAIGSNNSTFFDTSSISITRPGTALTTQRASSAVMAAAAAFEQIDRAEGPLLRAGSSSSSSSMLAGELWGSNSTVVAAGGLPSSFSRLASLIDVNDDHLVRTAGGLLHYLLKSRVINEAEPQTMHVQGGTASAGALRASAAGLDGSGGTGPYGGPSFSEEEDDTDRLLASLRADTVSAGPAAALPASSSSSAAAAVPSGCLYLPGGLHLFSLGDFMHIDIVTYASLNITSTAAHPASLAKGGNSLKAKEGFSLLALLDRTMSSPGKRLLRTWVKQPSLDMSVLLHRHDCVAFLMAAKAQCPDLYRELRSYMRAVKDLPRLLLKVKKVTASPSDWFSLHRTVLAANMVKDLLALMMRTVRMSNAAAVAVAAQAASRNNGNGNINVTSSVVNAAVGFGAAGQSSFWPSQGSSLLMNVGDGSGNPDSSATTTFARQQQHQSHLLPAFTEDTPYSPQHPYLLRQILSDFTAELVFLQNALDQVVDWDESRSRGRLSVRVGVDAKLDEYRRVYTSMPEFLGQASVAKLHEYPTLRSLTIKYLPQIGCVIAIDKVDNGFAAPPPPPQQQPPSTADNIGGRPSTAAAGASSSLPPATIPAGFTLQFETADSLIFKNAYTSEMDDYLGDIAAVISDLEASITRQLEEKASEYEPLLALVGMRLAELDVLMGFADVSLDYRYVRPKLLHENVLFVKGARHPLQELVTADTFVPNDIALAPGKEYSRNGSNNGADGSSSGSGSGNGGPSVGAVAIVTGPNFSGKSVYLKTAGLITVMAQIGCFVPAEKCALGLTDRLFSRIHSLETSTLAGQSSFSIDLSQVGLMMKHATPRSLLLIDEFGKGTSSVDGVSLLAATVRHILKLPQRVAAKEYAGLMRSLSIEQQQQHQQQSQSLPVVRLSLSNAPKTIITTHFREVFDHGLLGLEGLANVPLLYTPPAALQLPSSSSGSSAEATALVSVPMPAPAAAASTVDLSSNIAFYQMNVMLNSKRVKGGAATSGGSAVGGMGGMGGGMDTSSSASSSSSSSSSSSTSASSAAAASSGPDYEDDVVPLFKLVAGRAASSYGLACAARAGVPRFVTDRAASVSAMLKQSEAAVAPLSGYLEDDRRRAVERQQVQLVSLLLKPGSWVAAGSSGTTTATSQDLQQLVALMKGMCSSNSNGNSGGGSSGEDGRAASTGTGQDVAVRV